MTRSFKDRPAPAPRQPLAEVGEVAYLQVAAVNATGAFLDWGRPKDLLLPFSEQRYPPEVGRRVMVMVFEDDRGRPAASMRLDDFLEDAATGLAQGDAVTLVIGDRTDLGVKAVVEHRFWGLLYHDDLTQPIKRGQRLTGYVKRVREDGRLDLSLMPAGAARRDLAADKVLAALRDAQGFLALTDKTPAATVQARLGVSKGAFKQAIGGLYRRRLIAIEADGIRLLEGEE